MEKYDVLYVTDNYVDDGGITRSPLAETLKIIPGVRLSVAESAEGAMEIFEIAGRERKKIDMVITDLALERPNAGSSVLFMGRKHNPNAVLIVNTGYLFKDLVGKIPEDAEPVLVIQKPTGPSRIAEIVKNNMIAKEAGSLPQPGERGVSFFTPHRHEANAAKVHPMRPGLIVKI